MPHDPLPCNSISRLDQQVGVRVLIDNRAGAFGRSVYFRRFLVDFIVLRRKLLRWSLDNMAVLDNANPEMPEGFFSRLRENYHLLFAPALRGRAGISPVLPILSSAWEANGLKL
jgi:hypothetical protein